MAAIYKFTGYRVSGKLVTSHHQDGGVIVHRCFLYELCYVHWCFVQSPAKYNLFLFLVSHHSGILRVDAEKIQRQLQLQSIFKS